MLNNIKNNLHWIFYFASIICYVFYVNYNVSQIQLNADPLYFSIILLVVVLYTWIAISIVINQFSIKHCLYVVCFTGMIVALTILMLYGITPEIGATSGRLAFTPYPQILVYVFLMFFSFSLPIIFYKMKKASNPNISFLEAHRAQAEETKASNNQASDLSEKQDSSYNTDCLEGAPLDEEWEEASLEDLESGKYEII